MANPTLKDLEAVGLMLGADGKLHRTAKPSERAPPEKPPAPPGPKLNKWEKQYNDRLRLQMQAGQIKAFYAQAINLRLGDEKCWYKPDFIVVLCDGRLRFVEVKGQRHQAGLTKFKVAHNLYGFLGSWQMVTKEKGVWKQIYGDKE